MRKRRKFDEAARMLTRKRFRMPRETPSRDDCSVSIRDVLGEIFRKIEASRNPLLDELDSEWSGLMDDLVAGHARPVGLRGRTLIVHVDSSAWLNEIARFKREEMLRRLKQRFGDKRVTDISMKIGPLSARRDAREEKSE